MNSDAQRREGVKIVGGGTAKQIVGSSVSVQNGNDLSAANGYNNDPNSWPDGVNWDSADGPYTYY